ncbi:MAG: hypothetical protein H6702_24800 [Myxococcales bacterium]|nr:hypothetical protein [Myxococcales bacterium]
MAGTCLLRPDPALNALVIGVYAHALLHPRFRGRIRIHEIVLQSNHLHVLCSAATQEVVEDFEEYVASILAKRVGWLRGWRGRVWDARYGLSQVFPSKQRSRQRYLHGQGLPENLYASPSDNPCVSSYKAWSTGKTTLTGVWLDAQAMRDAGVAFDDPQRAEYEHELVVDLHPLPIDEGKTKAQLVAQTRAQGKSLIDEHAARREEEDVQAVLGAQAMLDASPFDRPHRTKKGRAAPLAIGTRAEVEASGSSPGERLTQEPAQGPLPSRFVRH